MSRVRVLLNSPINRARSPSPRPTWLLRLLILAILRSHPRRTLPLPSSRRANANSSLPVVVVVLLFFTTVRHLLSRASARSSFASSSGSAKFIAASSSASRVSSFSSSSYLSVRPSVRSSEVRKYRLVCPMTRRLLLRSFLPPFFSPSPTREGERERIFSRCRVSSLSSLRVHHSASLSLSPFSF